MADDSSDQPTGGAATAPASAATPAPVPGGSAEPPKKIPRGVVLGPDGKPCRNCTSFAAWAAQTKSTIKDDAARATPKTMQPPDDCPPDVEALGRSTWTLLHSIAATYPETPSRGQQSDLLSFVGLFSKLYPCWVCAEDFQGYMRKDTPKVASRDDFGKWLRDGGPAGRTAGAIDAMAHGWDGIGQDWTVRSGYDTHHPSVRMARHDRQESAKHTWKPWAIKDGSDSKQAARQASQQASPADGPNGFGPNLTFGSRRDKDDLMDNTGNYRAVYCKVQQTASSKQLRITNAWINGYMDEWVGGLTVGTV
ncbi:hypothetical protein G7046_g9448 [Stylonectria norvegica]|nr:hypothetical protein G7046_g9448 [Stylonectria norvegica]